MASCSVVDGAKTSEAVAGLARAPNVESLCTVNEAGNVELTEPVTATIKVRSTSATLEPSAHSAVVVPLVTIVWSGSSSIVAGVVSITSALVAPAATVSEPIRML